MLPRLPARVRRYQQEIVALRGVNYTDNFTDGDLAQSKLKNGRLDTRATGVPVGAPSTTARGEHNPHPPAAD